MRSAILTRALEAIADRADALADRVRPLEPLASHPSRFNLGGPVPAPHLHWLDDRAYEVEAFAATDLTDAINQMHANAAQAARTYAPRITIEPSRPWLNGEPFEWRRARLVDDETVVPHYQSTHNPDGTLRADAAVESTVHFGRIRHMKGW